MRLAAPLLVLASSLLLSGCGRMLEGTVYPGPSVTSAADSVVTVRLTDQGCRVDPETAAAPGNVAFVVTDDGSAGGSLEVLAVDQGPRTIGSVPDVTPGSTQTLFLRDVVPATYVLVCRPDAAPGDTRVELSVRG